MKNLSPTQQHIEAREEWIERYYKNLGKGGEMFEHEMGIGVESRVQKLKGIITSRSENLYGCNRYYIQPQADKEGKAIDGWWVDEEDIKYKSKGISVPKKGEKIPGGPMSKTR